LDLSGGKKGLKKVPKDEIKDKSGPDLVKEDEKKSSNSGGGGGDLMSQMMAKRNQLKKN